VREEAGELCQTLEENEGPERAANEAADLIYHTMVLLNLQARAQTKGKRWGVGGSSPNHVSGLANRRLLAPQRRCESRGCARRHGPRGRIQQLFPRGPWERAPWTHERRPWLRDIQQMSVSMSLVYRYQEYRRITWPPRSRIVLGWKPQNPWTLYNFQPNRALRTAMDFSSSAAHVHVLSSRFGARTVKEIEVI
jgi:hypothetical protein